MKILNIGLVNMTNTLNKYSKMKYPQKISYAITRNLMQLSKEYKIYEEQLNKIFSTYSNYMIKNENGEIKLNKNNIPIVTDEVKEEFYEQITDLLNIEIEIDLYYVDPDFFDYDDDKGIYDPMSAEDIIDLQSILCEQKGI